MGFKIWYVAVLLTVGCAWMFLLAPRTADALIPWIMMAVWFVVLKRLVFRGR